MKTKTVECKYKHRPKHIFPCSKCIDKNCNNPQNIPLTCHDCRYQHNKENGHNGCKNGLRPCKEFEMW